MVLHAPLAPMWRPLPALRCRRALLARAAKAPDAPENAALACIRRAKQAAGKLPLDAAQAAPPLASTLPVPGTDVVARFESAAQAAASEEERAFLGALSARPEQPAAARGAPAASAPPLPVKGTSPAALRARLAKAREYRAKAKPAPQAAGGAAPAAGQAPSAVAGAEAQPGAQPAMAAAGGSAEQAAGFLRDVLESGAAADAGVLSPEQFTLKREAEQRSRGAELITIDASAKQEAAGAAYRPKVATWGVFPRPANISREFGGGRTIQPGQALEPEEVREARKARVAAAMAAYRKDQGLTIEPAVAAEAQAAMAAGAQQVRDGRLAEALALFCAAADAVPLRSRLGGEATLQRAICLDSMGCSAEAKALYQSVERHPAPGIAKKARQMLFGFKAMDHLKAHTMSYGVGSAYDSYFARLTGKWAVYVAPEGSEKANSLDALMATAVLLAPILLVGVKIGGRLLAK